MAKSCSTLAFASRRRCPRAGLRLSRNTSTAGSEKLGTVRFATSCTPAAQPAFDRAMALLHSFEFAPAIESFTAAEHGRSRLRDCLLGHRAQPVG